jgi:hypothetical protein
VPRRSGAGDCAACLLWAGGWGDCPHESDANAAKSDIAITKQRSFMRPQSPFRKRNDSPRHYIEIQVAQHGVEPRALARPRGAREKPDRESELG